MLFQIHLQVHRILGKVLEEVRAQGMVLTAYSPLARGDLFADPVLRRIGDPHGKSPGQVALRWLIQKPGVTAPIIGARGISQLETNLGASGWELSSEDMLMLDAVSEKEAPYPVTQVSVPRT